MALSLAKRLDEHTLWVCLSVGVDDVKHILYAASCVCLMLVLLKTWSILDIFMDYWEMTSNTYKLRSMAYLGENYGVGICVIALTRLIRKMTLCKNARAAHARTRLEDLK